MRQIKSQFEAALSELNWDEVGVNVDEPHLVLGDHSGEARFDAFRRVMDEAIGNAPDTLGVNRDRANERCTGIAIGLKEAKQVCRLLNMDDSAVVVRSVSRYAVTRSGAVDATSESWQEGPRVAIEDDDVLGLPTATIWLAGESADFQLLDDGLGSFIERLNSGSIEGHSVDEDMWVIESERDAHECPISRRVRRESGALG